MSELIKAVSDSTFEQEVLQSDQPVLVDFWAEWCGPCRMLAPVLVDIVDEYAGRLKVVKVDVDENQQTPAKYAVRGIPSLYLFKNGEVVESKAGALSKGQLTGWLNAIL